MESCNFYDIYVIFWGGICVYKNVQVCMNLHGKEINLTPFLTNILHIFYIYEVGFLYQYGNVKLTFWMSVI